MADRPTACEVSILARSLPSQSEEPEVVRPGSKESGRLRHEPLACRHDIITAMGSHGSRPVTGNHNPWHSPSRDRASS